MEDFVVTVLVLILIFAVAFTGYGVGQESPNNHAKFRVVCEYRGGEVQDDVCLLNDKVIDRYEN